MYFIKLHRIKKVFKICLQILQYVYYDNNILQMYSRYKSYN